MAQTDHLSINITNIMDPYPISTNFGRLRVLVLVLNPSKSHLKKIIFDEVVIAQSVDSISQCTNAWDHGIWANYLHSPVKAINQINKALSSIINAVSF
jgi:hypothetical protein